MAIESSYPAITDLAGTEIMTAITTPGVAGGTKTISTSAIANSTIITERIRDVVGTLLVAGANMSINVDDAGNVITLTAGTSSSYTDEQARDAIGAALVGELGYIDVTPNDAGDQIVISTNQTLKDSLSALGAKPLIQSNDNVTAGGAVYVNLPGSSGNYVSTPDSAALDIDGALDVRVRVSLTDWTPTAAITLAAKWNTGALSWLFRVNATGAPALVVSIDGTTTGTIATSAFGPTVSDGQTIWMRVVRISATGSTDFSWAPDSTVEPTTWTNLSINRSSSAGVLANTTAETSIGGHNGGTSGFGAGKWYRTIIRDGATIVGDMNAVDWTSGTTWTGPAGNVWTLAGTAAILSGAGGGISNTSSEFVLTQIDAHPTIALAQHDTMMFFSTFAFVNTSASSATFTPKVSLNGVDLFTFPAITVASAVGASRTGSLALRITMNAADGSGQVASAELALGNAVSGNTDLGGTVAATDQIRLTANRVASGVTTFTSIPLIEVKLTMSIANVGIAARRLSSQLFLAKA